MEYTRIRYDSSGVVLLRSENKLLAEWTDLDRVCMGFHGPVGACMVCGQSVRRAEGMLAEGALEWEKIEGLA